MKECTLQTSHQDSIEMKFERSLMSSKTFLVELPSSELLKLYTTMTDVLLRPVLVGDKIETFMLV